jgi:hypothetical protein
MTLTKDRRGFLQMLAGFAVVIALPRTAGAKDGEGGDDGGHDDGGHDDGRDGRDRGEHRDDDLSQDDALKAVQSGRLISLKRALGIVNSKLNGKVIDVKLSTAGGRPQYRMKVRQTNGAITTIRLDARTGRFVGLLGF